MKKEKIYIKDLAKETMEYALSSKMNERRALWSNHNSLTFTRPPIYIRSIPFDEFFDAGQYLCTDPFLRSLERMFLLNRYRMRIDDDYIIEPFLTVRAVLKTAKEGVYGVPAELGEHVPGIKAVNFMPSILEESDFSKLQVADYEVDEEQTALLLNQMQEAVGDVIPLEVDRQGILCEMWNNDISTLLARMRGLEQIMWDAYDRPEWLHKLIAFMQEKILLQMDQTMAAGGFKLFNHQNQAMPYARELRPPMAGSGSVSQKELWGYMAAQEFTTFGPDLFEEFMYKYQKPILERYGLVAYGCCENLNQKISVIRSLKNLRRIAVSPFADVKKCAEQIGSDYIVSWRPSPSLAVSFGIDEDYIRKNLRETFDVFDSNHCKFDITLKDVETVLGDESAIIRWTSIVREEIAKRYE